MMATRSPRASPAPASSAASWLLRTARSPAVTRSAASLPFSKTKTSRSGSRAASALMTRLRTAASSVPSMSVPAGHVFADLWCGRPPAVELLVEGLVDVVDDRREVALQRVHVGGALPVAVDHVVHVGDGRLPGPVRHLGGRVVDDGPGHVGRERPVVDHVVVLARRERHAL